MKTEIKRELIMYLLIQQIQKTTPSDLLEVQSASAFFEDVGVGENWPNAIEVKIILRPLFTRQLLIATILERPPLEPGLKALHSIILASNEHPFLLLSISRRDSNN